MKRNFRFGAFAGLAALCLTATASANPLEVPVPIQMNVFGLPLAFSHETIVVCAAVAVLIFLACGFWARGMNKDNPSKGQVLLEAIVGMFDDLCKQSIGPVRGRKYLPYIGTLFLFIWTCNMAGLLPVPEMHLGAEHYEDLNENGLYDPGEPYEDTNSNNMHDAGFPVPAFEEPTKNLNVPLGMAVLFVVLIGHGSQIRIHGITGYIKDYFSPGGFIGVAMFPLNVVGKIAEVVSISFRLFGNIFGGVVIITVVSGLLYHVIFPVGLYGFFGVFVGTVQAFVFTMLALTYIAMGAAEE